MKSFPQKISERASRKSTISIPPDINLSKSSLSPHKILKSDLRKEKVLAACIQIDEENSGLIK